MPKKPKGRVLDNIFDGFSDNNGNAEGGEGDDNKAG